MNFRTAPLLAAPALAALALAACSLDSQEQRPAIALADCRLPGVDVAARCGRHEVWEHRVAKAGRRIELHVDAAAGAARTGGDPGRVSRLVLGLF